MNLARIGMLAALCLPAIGCGSSCPSTPSPSISPTELGGAFDAATTGELRGTVTWNGELPDVAPLIVNVPGQPTKSEPNPNQPRINPKTRTIAGALVYLHTVDLARSRPWDHDAVRVAVEGGRIHVYQGDTKADVGIVRQGDSVEWANRDSEFFSLRARGAAFFSLPFVNPNATHRPLTERGHVEISSGSGQYWLRGQLFVSAHPYVCVTDEKGAFHLPKVPEGDYEVYCWLPSWDITERQTDAESRALVRLVFGAPWLASRPVHVARRETLSTSLSLGGNEP